MKIKLPDIPESEQTPRVKSLLGIIEQLCETVERQREEIKTLKDEVRVLKGQKKRPKFKASKLDKSTDNEKPENETGASNNKRPGSAKKSKNKDLVIHQDKVVQPDSELKSFNLIASYLKARVLRATEIISFKNWKLSRIIYAIVWLTISDRMARLLPPLYRMD